MNAAASPIAVVATSAAAALIFGQNAGEINSGEIIDAAIAPAM
jgi:hypothetical protein